MNLGNKVLLDLLKEVSNMGASAFSNKSGEVEFSNILIETKKYQTTQLDEQLFRFKDCKVPALFYINKIFESFETTSHNQKVYDVLLNDLNSIEEKLVAQEYANVLIHDKEQLVFCITIQYKDKKMNVAAKLSIEEICFGEYPKPKPLSLNYYYFQ